MKKSRGGDDIYLYLELKKQENKLERVVERKRHAQ